MDKYKIAVRNASVLDFKSGDIEKRDIYIENDIFVDSFSDNRDVFEWDVNGSYVFPGLVDHHVHVFYGGSNIGIKPDWLLPYGVTTAVDAGTSGCANYESFYNTNILPATVNIKTYLNIYSGGQPAVYIDEDFSPKKFDKPKIQQLLSRYYDNIIGFKIRFSRGIFPDGDEALEWLKQIYELIDGLDKNLPLCIHVTDAPVDTNALLSIMRKNDVFCHCFHGKGNTILEDDGTVKQSAWDAKKRGVIFDAANGRSGFAFSVAEKAISQGFLPDIISTDATHANFNTPRYASSLIFLLSKFMELGMTFSQALQAMTKNPANLVGEFKRGHIKSGMQADLVVVDKVEQDVEYWDVLGSMRKGSFYFLPKATIVNGNVVYRVNGF